MLPFMAAASRKGYTMSDICVRYMGADGIEVKAVSKDMLQKIESLDFNDSPGQARVSINIGKNIIERLDGFCKITVKDKSRKSGLKSDIESVVASRPFGKYMSINDKSNGNQSIQVYTDLSRHTISQLVIVIENADAYTVLYMNGEISPETLESLVRFR